MTRKIVLLSFCAYAHNNPPCILLHLTRGTFLRYTLKNPQWNAPAMWYRLEYPLDYSTPRVFLPESPYAEALHGYKPPAYAPQSTMDKKYAPKGTGDCISILYVYAEGLK